MSPEKQRIAIAKICGAKLWKNPTNFGPLELWSFDYPSPSSIFDRDRCDSFSLIPDYLNDLNATHEAFKRLGRHWEISQVHDGYYCRIQFGPQGKDIVVAGLELSTVMAEAFLRALNKWEGGDHE